jgi:hypothetical protein
LRYVVSKKAYNKPLKKGEGIKKLAEENYLYAYELQRDGLPIVYDEMEDNVCLLHPMIAAILSKDEVEDLKSKNVITCGESIRILNERGFNIGFDSIAVPEADRGAVLEIYEEDELNGTLKKTYLENHYTAGRFESHELVNLPKGTRVLGRYKHNFSNENAINGKVATAIVPMNEGKKWAVFGYSLWKVVKTISERERILNVYDALANKAFARILSTEQAAINIRRDENGFVRAISLTNCSIGVEENIKVFVKKPFGCKAVFWGQYHARQEIAMEAVEDGFVVTFPRIEPWSVATVFFG